MKKFLLLAALACGSLSAMAQTLTVNGVATSTAYDEDMEVLSKLTFNFSGLSDYTAFQCDIKFPEGVNPYYLEEDVMDINCDAIKNFSKLYSYASKVQADGTLRVVLWSGSNRAFGVESLPLDVTVVSVKGVKSGDLNISNILVGKSKPVNNQIESGSVSLSEVTSTGVAVKVSESKYATLALPFDAELPEGIKAYNATTDTEDFLIIKEDANSSFVSAHKPVFLKSENVVDDVIAFGMATEGTSENGMIKGVYETTSISNGFVLVNNGGKAEMKTLKGAVELPAYRAYVDGASGIKGFKFDTETGISDINENEVNTIYNVAGQRLNKTQKGVNIVNGKKFIVK